MTAIASEESFLFYLELARRSDGDVCVLRYLCTPSYASTVTTRARPLFDGALLCRASC